MTAATAPTGDNAAHRAGDDAVRRADIAARAMARDLKTPAARLGDRIARLNHILDRRDAAAGEIAREAAAIGAIAEDVAAAAQAITRRVAIDLSRQPGDPAR